MNIVVIMLSLNLVFVLGVVEFRCVDIIIFVSVVSIFIFMKVRNIMCLELMLDSFVVLVLLLMVKMWWLIVVCFDRKVYSVISIVMMMKMLGRLWKLVRVYVIQVSVMKISVFLVMKKVKGLLVMFMVFLCWWLWICSYRMISVVF